LTVLDTNRFYKYLKNVGYYRLTGYMYPFQLADGSHTFKQPTSFDLVLNHYLFDKKLRFIILEAIERIEISIRTNISNTMALKFGPHWYLDQNYFDNSKLHSDFIGYVTSYCLDAREGFIRNYTFKYNDPVNPPSWMMIETLTFGRLASLYENLKDNQEKKEIAESYDCVVPILESWLKSLNFIRNCCAHHSRLWNRKIPLKPTIPSRKKHRFLDIIDEDTNKRLYGVLSCILFLTKSISPDSHLKDRLKRLFSEYPEINLTHMGFHEKWEQEIIWK
jgi:abortive infection bacteriophage resistance protein